MTGLALFGGWGYSNLGDEAILAGYVSELGQRAELSILSANARLTRARQNDSELRILSELNPLNRRRLRDFETLVCGGGYLNGAWTQEILEKLTRLNYFAKNPAVVHGVEIRGLAQPALSGLIEPVRKSSRLAVRDNQSQQECLRLGTTTEPDVLPDSISLLAHHYPRYLRGSERIGTGKILLNLLDIGVRGDSGEAEVSVDSWRSRCADIVNKLGSQAVGLVVGNEDETFMRGFSGLELFRPRNVSELLGVLSDAEAVLSVRMHPALIADFLGTPVAAIAYCGKVRPTLTKIGIEDRLVADLSLDGIHDHWADMANRDSQHAWEHAYRANSHWLSDALGL